MAENRTLLYNEDQALKEDGEVDSGSNDISPGMLVGSFGNSDYAVNTTTGEANPEVRVARAHKEIGHEADDGADAYSSGDHLKVAHCQRGVGVELVLVAGADLATASEANISEGDKLVTAGAADDGAVKAQGGSDGDAVFAIATEAVDNSGAASGETTKLEAEVL